MMNCGAWQMRDEDHKNSKEDEKEQKRKQQKIVGIRNLARYTPTSEAHLTTGRRC
jgi:hypothetical protein